MAIFAHQLCLMIFLLGSLVFSTLVFIFFKFFDQLNISVLPAITVNYLLAGMLSYLFSNMALPSEQLFLQPWSWIAVLTGMSFVLTFYFFGIGTQRNGASATVVSSKMSIVLTATIGFVYFAEPFNWLKVAGILLSAVALVLTNLKANDRKFSWQYVYLPAFVFVGTTCNDSLMKLSGIRYPGIEELSFLTVTFFSAFAVSGFICGMQMIYGNLKITRNDLAGGAVLSVFNWLSTVFFIKGVYRMPISVFVPVFNAALVAVAAVAGYFFFREKISRTNLAGIALAVISILVIAMF